jgi:prepilin-type N-terminal cleavage/methylation domain-containing protein
MNNVLPSSRIGNDECGMANGGFSIMEVLVAVMIIGVLAVILVPVLTTRAREARVAACESELQALAEAQKTAAIHTGYFLRLYALDDLPGSAVIPPGAAGVDRIVDEALNMSVSNPTQMFIDPSAKAFNNVLSIAPFAKILQESEYGWKGPFCNIKRDEKPNESWPPRDMSTGGWTLPTHIHGIPNDPWGNDYLLFTRWGLIQEPKGSLWSDPVSVDAIDYSTVVFDRPTILSLGPDGKPGNGTAGSKFGEGDDIYRSFEY